MKRHKVIITVTIVVIIIFGSVPGLEALIIDLSSPFQHPDGQYWKALIEGISSIVVGVLIGYFLSTYLLRIWFKTGKSLLYNSIIILFITYITGIITLMAAWEITWIVPRIFNWEYTGEFNPWSNLLDHYLLMFMYGSIPVGVLGVLNGLFSIIYCTKTTHHNSMKFR